MKNVTKKLLEVIGSVSGKVEKSGYNSHQKYKYVMEADLLDAVRAEIVKAGLLLTSSVESVERDGNITTVRLKHTITDTASGEQLEVWSAGQGADNQDKGVFKAITGANKYFLLKTFLLAGDDDPENDGVSKPAPAKAPTMKVAAPKPAAPQTEPVQAKADAATASPAPVTGVKKTAFMPKAKAPVQGQAPADPKASAFSFGVTKVDPSTLPEVEEETVKDDIEF